MSANSPGSVFLSVTLHAAIVAVILFFTYFVQQKVPELPKIFELVAGEGDNYAATEAPAASSDQMVKFNMPKVARSPTPVPTPTPPAPEPEPVVQKAPEPRKVEPSPIKPAPEPKKTVPKPEPKAEPVKKMTKAEFDRLHANQPNPTKVTQSRPVQVKTINVKGITGGSVTAKSGAGGKALTKAESDALEGYIALLLQRLRAAHSKPAGLSDLLQAKVRFSIAANGTLSNVKIITSSGSREFDQSVLEAFAKVRSIGAVPNGKGDVWEVIFRMREDG